MAHARALGATNPSVEIPLAAAGSSAATARALFAQPLAPMLTVVAVAMLVVVGITSSRTSGLVAALWAANAVAVGMWLRTGRGLTFDISFGCLIAVGVLAGEFLAGNGPTLSLVFTVANMVEIVCAVLMARRFAPTLNLASVGGAARFMFSVGVVPPLLSGLISAAAIGMTKGGDVLPSLQTWWFGHALGLVVVGSFILSLTARSAASLRNPFKVLEGVALFGLLGGVCVVVHFLAKVPLGFALSPVLILIAARLRVPGVTAALVIVTASAMTSLIVGAGPWRFVVVDVTERAMVLQLTILFGYAPIVLVASLLEERDRLSERARAGQVRAERASVAKSRLLANVAHEIKSPIGGVIGIGELWSSGQLGPVTETQAEMAEMLVKTARQVEALSHDLLDVARAESGAVKVELRPTDVPGILEDIRRATVLRPQARGISITVRSEGDGLVAIADSQRLAQVIDNLAVNALKYGGTGGSVVFGARRVHDGVRIEVVDKGPGIDPEKQAQLFEPFNRLGLERSKVEGHGIGLALAKRLVELQGGSIGVISTPGEGATFWIELPAA